MRRFAFLTATVVSLLVGLAVMSCTTIPTPSPVEDATAQTLKALDALQEAEREGASPTELQSHVLNLRQQLEPLCRPYLAVEEQTTSPTATLTANTAVTQVVPQSATSNQEKPSEEEIEQLETGVSETHQAPLDELLDRSKGRAVAEQCHRAMELLATIDNSLATQDFDLHSLNDILISLREAVEKILATV